MRINSSKELEKYIRQGTLPEVILLSGEESYYIRRIMKALAGADPGSDISVIRIQGDKCDMDELAYSLESISMFSGGKKVLLEDLAPEKLSSSDYEKLCEVLGCRLSEDTPLIITGAPDSFCVKKPSQRAKRIEELCDKAGVSAVLQRSDRKDIVKLLQKRAREKGSSMSSAAAAALLRRCGEDTNLLLNETDKLSAYAPGREITEEDIKKLSPEMLDSAVFELSRQLISGGASAALSVLDELLQQRIAPAAILSQLSLNYVDIYRARAAMEAGISRQTACSELGYKGGSAYRMEKAFGYASRCDDSYVSGAITLLRRADREIKSSKLPARTVIERTIIQLSLLGGKR